MLGSPQEDVEELFRRYRERREPAVRDRLVVAHLAIADHCARRFVRRGVPWDDLRQIARLALVKAVDRFDPELGWAFSTFASATIYGHLRHYFRDRTWSLSVPRGVKDLYVRLPESIGRLAQRLGRPPTISELAADLRVSDELVGEAFACQAVYAPLSIDAPGASESIGQTIGGEDERLEVVDGRLSVREAIASLPEVQRRVLYLRYFEDATQSAIASRLGVNQMRVSRMLRAALEQVRRAVLAPDDAVRPTRPVPRARPRRERSRGLAGRATFCRTVRPAGPPVPHGLAPVVRGERLRISALPPPIRDAVPVA